MLIISVKEYTFSDNEQHW